MTRKPLSALLVLTTLSAALLAGCASAPADKPAEAKPAAAAADAAKTDGGALKPLLVWGNAGSVAPNVLYLGTPANWAFRVPKDGLGSMDAGAIKAEPTKVGDNAGLKVTWTGGAGQIYSQSKTVNDQFDYIEAKSALVFDAILHQAPEGQVQMRVDCRYPCIGVVDATEHFKKLPLEKLTSVKVPLACFEKTGTKFMVVNTPWLLWSDKPMTMSVANVRYVPGAANDPDVVKCPM